MEKNRFLVYYLISGNNDVHPQKLPYTKTECIDNFVKHFPDSHIIFCLDRVTDDLWEYMDTIITRSGHKHNMLHLNGGSHSASFLAVLDHIAHRTLPDSKPILIQEDDYLYLPDAEKHMLEALDYADYVTGYLHPDKFMHPNDGGNPSTTDTNVSEPTKVVKTSNHFWMLTNSTTGTFATTVETLRADLPIWKKYTVGKRLLEDYNAFKELRQRGRSVLMPIPTLSTHIMTRWLAPLISTGYDSWEDVLLYPLQKFNY